MQSNSTQSLRAYPNRGNVKLSRGDLDGAIADNTRAIELDPKYARAYVLRGNAYGTKGDKPKAIVDYTRAIELDPNSGQYSKAARPLEPEEFYINYNLCRLVRVEEYGASPRKHRCCALECYVPAKRRCFTVPDSKLPDA